MKDKLCEEGKSIFNTTFSVPSFEYWLLIHFKPSTKPYSATYRKSIGDQVIDDLKVFMPDYKKTQRGVFNRLLQQGMLDGAIANAKRILATAKKNQNMNPSTNVHELIEYLRDLKK